MNNGDLIIISVPPLTEERRRDSAKQAKVKRRRQIELEMLVKTPI
jgi:ribosome recycling factor